jgi:HK97 gp10 family phage protein
MSIEFSGKIEGSKELENALNQLPKALAKSALVSMMKQSAKPVLADAKVNVPKRTGRLRDSLIIGASLSRRQKSSGSQKGFAEVFVGASWPSGAHAHLIEFGTKNMSAIPFLRPAWDSNRDTMFKDIQKVLWAILVKKARTLAKKAGAGKLGSRTIGELR